MLAFGIPGGLSPVSGACRFSKCASRLYVRGVSHRNIAKMKAPTLVPVDGPAVPESLVGPNPVYAQCMIRISDPEKSVDFYQNKLGMKFLTRLDFEDLKFSLLFLAYTDDVVPDPSMPQSERAAWLWTRPYPTMELTYNWPSTAEPPEELFNGNTKPHRGFGHTGFLLENAADFVERASESGVKVVRPVGPFADIATIGFVADPDSYWCEIIQKPATAISTGVDRALAGKDPVFAQAMLRINDPKATIEFFQRLGMKFLTQLDVPEGDFSLYFLAYTDVPVPPQNASRAEKSEWLFKLRECTVELTHNWLDEGETPEEYTNGNEKGRRGFGHLGIVVDNVAEATKSLEEAGYVVVRPAGPFRDVANISFVSTPGEAYWVELIQRRS